MHIDNDDSKLNPSKWVMRFVLDFERVNFKNLDMDFIEERL